MIKWIKNSQAKTRRSSSDYLGVAACQGKYRATLTLYKPNKDTNLTQSVNIHIGTYDTAKEAMKARVEYILNLL